MNDTDWKAALVRLVPSTARILTGKADAGSSPSVLPAVTVPTTGYGIQRLTHSADGKIGTPCAKRQASPAAIARKAWRSATVKADGSKRIIAPSGKVYSPLADGQAIDGSRCGVLSPDTSGSGTYYKPYHVARYSQRMQTSRKVAATKVEYRYIWTDVKVLDLGCKVDPKTGKHGAPLGTIAVAVERPELVDASVKATLGVNTSTGIAGATSQAECNRAARKASKAQAVDAFFAGL